MKNKIFEDLAFNNYKILEADGSQGDLGTLPNGVLAVVKGPAFFLNGFSRNGRFYPENLWENAINKNDDFKRKMERGLVFGCIGHPENYTIDSLIESGKVSHKVVKIDINKKKEIGEATYHVLDTPAGRILNTILRSGSNPYVSTRAFGGFKENETVKKGNKEYRVLDENNFILESIDFVTEPGFLETNPKLVESIKEDLNILENDKHKIECKDGICNLITESKKLEDTNELESKIVLEELEQLDKNSLISMIENISMENIKLRKISEAAGDFDKTIKTDNTVDNKASNKQSTDDNTPEVDIEPKKLRNLLSYVELLLKLVKYNANYNDDYDVLVNFLDLDNKVTKKDIKDLSIFIDKCLSDEDIDESIKTICEKIHNIIENMNEEILSFVDDLYNSIIEFKENLKKDSKENDKNENSNDKEIEILKYTIDALVEENIKLSNIKSFLEEANEAKKEIDKNEKIYEKLYNNSINKIDEIQENILFMEENINTIKFELSQKISENKDLKNKNKMLLSEKEALEEEFKEKELLIESNKSLKEELKDIKEKIKKSKDSLKENAKKYYSGLYKVDASDISEAFSKYDILTEDEKIQTFLSKKEKLFKRNNIKDLKEEIKDLNYKPIRKKSMLAERLI